MCGSGRVRVRSGTRAVENVSFAPATPAYTVLPRRPRVDVVVEVACMFGLDLDVVDDIVDSPGVRGVCPAGVDVDRRRKSGWMCDTCRTHIRR